MTVVTEPFVELAHLVASGLGMPAKLVVLPHPVGRLGLEAIQELAMEAVATIEQHVRTF